MAFSVRGSENTRKKIRLYDNSYLGSTVTLDDFSVTFRSDSIVTVWTRCKVRSRLYFFSHG